MSELIVSEERELLTAICENPGWSPPEPVSSSVERVLKALAEQNLIIGGLDGWHASEDALDAYPYFKGLGPELESYEPPLGDQTRETETDEITMDFASLAPGQRITYEQPVGMLTVQISIENMGLDAVRVTPVIKIESPDPGR